jgi:hypothetical protein
MIKEKFKCVGYFLHYKQMILKNPDIIDYDLKGATFCISGV